jgi:hypothetical protein
MHNKLLVLGIESLLSKKGRDFIGGHCIIFSFFFGLIICYESQTWSLMIIEKI